MYFTFFYETSAKKAPVPPHLHPNDRTYIK